MNAIHRLVLSAAALAAVLIGVCASPAAADDEPIFADGGSLVTSLDAGSNVTVDVGVHSCWNMAVGECTQLTRYSLCVSLPCTATSANQSIPDSKTYDVPVNCGPNAAVLPKRYLSLTTDDGGVPACKVQHSPF